MTTDKPAAWGDDEALATLVRCTAMKNVAMLKAKHRPPRHEDRTADTVRGRRIRWESAAYTTAASAMR